MTIVYFSIVIMVLVFFHELGHFLFARVFKMKVDVFSVGMGPEILSKIDKYGTKWRLAIIPIGGYVKVLEGSENKNQQGSLESKPVWQRMIMVFAGPVFSVLLGWIIFFGMFGIWGKPTMADYSQKGINKVVVGSPAEISGLQTGDIITEITSNGKVHKITSFYNMYNAIQQTGEKQSILTVKRAGNDIKIKITPRPYNTEKGDVVYRIGVTAHPLEYKEMTLLDSFSNANDVSIRASLAIYNGIIDMFKNGIDKENVGGPIKIAQMSGQSGDMGLFYLLQFMALLSINLGILNMIPLPILDGGRLVLLTVEGIIRRPLPENLVNPIMAFSVVLMIVLFVFITMVDIGIL